MTLTSRLRAQEVYPTTKAGWIERIARIHAAIGEDYGAMYHLAQQDDDLIYQVTRDGWTRFNGDGVKSYLLGMLVEGKMPPPDRTGAPGVPFPPNPHLLEILNLGMTDTRGEPIYAARHHLYGLAFTDFYDKPKEYQAWYQVASAKPIETVIRDGMTDYIARLDHAADPATKRRLLEIANEVPFKSGASTRIDVNGNTITTIQTNGLTGIRRKLALETGLLEKWLQLAGPNESLDVAAPAALNVLNFMPGPEFLQAHDEALHAILARISEDPKSNYYNSSGQYLGYFQKPWAVDLLLKRLVSDFQSDGLGGLLNSLQYVTDPRVIPTLIVLLESGEMEGWYEQMTQAALKRLGGPSAKKNLGSWRDWWKEHRNEFPEEVRAMPFPHVLSASEEAHVVMVRKQSVQIHIDGDEKRTYELFTPGMLLPRAPQPPGDADGRPFVAVQDRPGLIVVLSDSDPSNRPIEEFWKLAVTKAFGNRYLVAVAMAPRWGNEKPYTWVTSQNQSLTPAAKFSVEPFASEIVADVLARYPIRPDRIFLHGEGGGGIAAYSCSLQPQTPFRGFSLLATAFHSAQLPAADRRKRPPLLHPGRQRGQGDSLLSQHQCAEPVDESRGCRGPAAPLRGAHAALQHRNAGSAGKSGKLVRKRKMRRSSGG